MGVEENNGEIIIEWAVESDFDFVWKGVSIIADIEG